MESLFVGVGVRSQEFLGNAPQTELKRNLHQGSRKNYKSDFLALVSSGIRSLLVTSAKKVALLADINWLKPLSVKAFIFNQQSLIRVY